MLADRRHIVVVGLMGSGKTTLGRSVAQRLGRPFVDSDAAIEAAGGRTAREIADTDGIDALHRLEADGLIRALSAEMPSVVAAAASTIDAPECRRRLGGPDVGVVWLRGSPEALASRASAGGHRPLLEDHAVKVLAAQAAHREPFFTEVADIIVDVDDRSPNEVLQAALTAVEH